MKTMKKFLSKEQAEKLSTKRLLAYKNKLMKFKEGPDWDEEDEITKIISKASPEWKEAYSLCKDILKTRENI